MLVLLTGTTGFSGTRLATLLPAQGRCAGADPRTGFIPAGVAHDSEKSRRPARLTGGAAVSGTVGTDRAWSGA